MRYVGDSRPIPGSRPTPDSRPTPGRPQGSPLLWTGLESRFVGIALPGSPYFLALFHHECHSPAQSEGPPRIHPAALPLPNPGPAS
jgi:hypothetical protein